MNTDWLVVVHPFSVTIELTDNLQKWDWSCEIEGVTHRYKVTSGVFNMPPNGQERAQVEIMSHARNIANDAPVIWATRGRKAPVLSKRTKEAQNKTKRMF